MTRNAGGIPGAALPSVWIDVLAPTEILQLLKGGIAVGEELLVVVYVIGENRGQHQIAGNVWLRQCLAAEKRHIEKHAAAGATSHREDHDHIERITFDINAIPVKHLLLRTLGANLRPGVVELASHFVVGV